jgi:hypothetical protein
MAVAIDLNKISFAYEADRKCFVVSEKDVSQFATTYMLISTSGAQKKFDMTHSTGSEWDPNTRYVYKSEDGLLLEVCNDAQMFKTAAANYLAGKLKK